MAAPDETNLIAGRLPPRLLAALRIEQKRRKLRSPFATLATLAAEALGDASLAEPRPMGRQRKETGGQ